MKKNYRRKERTCRYCGCNNHSACEGGCFWDVCSVCQIKNLIKETREARDGKKLQKD